MVKLTKEEIYTLFEALSMSYGFYIDTYDPANRVHVKYNTKGIINISLNCHL